MSISLTNAEIERYKRQLGLKTFGLEGQKALKKARILCIGMGGLGCPLSYYLTAMGLGRLGIVDGDIVDSSNLPRQILYKEQDIGRLKVEVAQQSLHAINHYVEIKAIAQKLDLKLALTLFPDYDLIIDGTDNFEAKYLINDVCSELQKTFIYTSVYQFEGQLSLFSPGPQSPCLRCLYPNPPTTGLIANCAENGIIAVVPGIFAMLQVLEIVKWLTGMKNSLINQLLNIDLLSLHISKFHIRQDRYCQSCAGQMKADELTRPQNTSIGIELESEGLIQIAELKQWMEEKNLLILDVREPWEFQIDNLKGSLNIPMNEVQTRMEQLPRDKRIVVLCQTGRRSYVIMNLLKKYGFVEVKSLDGGLVAYRNNASI